LDLSWLQDFLELSYRPLPIGPAFSWSLLVVLLLVLRIELMALMADGGWEWIVMVDIDKPFSLVDFSGRYSL